MRLLGAMGHFRWLIPTLFAVFLSACSTNAIDKTEEAKVFLELFDSFQKEDVAALKSRFSKDLASKIGPDDKVLVAIRDAKSNGIYFKLFTQRSSEKSLIQGKDSSTIEGIFGFEKHPKSWLRVKLTFVQESGRLVIADAGAQSLQGDLVEGTSFYPLDLAKAHPTIGIPALLVAIASLLASLTATIMAIVRKEIIWAVFNLFSMGAIVWAEEGARLTFLPMEFSILQIVNFGATLYGRSPVHYQILVTLPVFALAYFWRLVVLRRAERAKAPNN